MHELDDRGSVSAPFIKVAFAWIASGVAHLGIASWSDLAAVLASVYSSILIVEWAWKKFGRGFFERRGWLKARKRRTTDLHEVVDKVKEVF